MKKLINLKGLLSRDEMRQIQGGSGFACYPGGYYNNASGCACLSGSQCIMGVCNINYYSWLGTCA